MPAAFSACRRKAEDWALTNAAQVVQVLAENHLRLEGETSLRFLQYRSNGQNSHPSNPTPHDINAESRMLQEPWSPLKKIHAANRITIAIFQLVNYLGYYQAMQKVSSVLREAPGSAIFRDTPFRDNPIGMKFSTHPARSPSLAFLSGPARTFSHQGNSPGPSMDAHVLYSINGRSMSINLHIWR